MRIRPVIVRSEFIGTWKKDINKCLHVSQCVVLSFQKGEDKTELPENKKQKFDKSAYDREYQKKNFTRVSVVLHKEHDKDVIEHLKPKPSKSEYIKSLIRQDMEK